jgi:hypothetical protein
MFNKITKIWERTEVKFLGFRKRVEVLVRLARITLLPWVVFSNGRKEMIMCLLNKNIVQINEAQFSI